MKHPKKHFQFVHAFLRRHPHFLLNVILPITVLLVAAIGAQVIRNGHAATICTVDAKLVNSCRPWIGAWSMEYSQAATDRQPQLLYHEQRVGRKMDLIKDYITPGKTLNSYDTYFHARAGTYIVVTWRPATKWADAGGGNASVNSQIDRMADSIKAVGPKKIFLSLHHEPENDVSSGSTGCGTSVHYKGNTGTPAQYRAMWQNVRRRFDARGVNNVVWTQILTGYKGWACMYKELYPGDQYVDWIMADLYATSDRDQWDKSVSEFYDWFSINSSPGYNFLSKNWGLAEQSTHLQSKANSVKFWADAKVALDSDKYPKLKAFMVFDSNRGKPDNRIMYWCDPATATTPTNPDGTGTCGHLEVDNAEQNAYKAFALDPKFTDAYYATHAPLAQDSTKPAISVAPTSSAVKVKTTTTINTNATDNVAVTKVQFFVNGSEQTVDTTKPFALSWTPKTTGNYTLTARAFDAWGNNTMSAPVTVVVNNTGPANDTVKPTVLITASPTSVAVNGMIALTATATDNVGVTKVEFYVDGALKTTVTAAPWVYSWKALTQGGKTITAKAYDAAGNIGDSNAVSVTVTGAGGVVLGDVDGDKAVNVNDYTALKINYGKPFPAGDFNKSGAIDSTDFGVIYGNWRW